MIECVISTRYLFQMWMVDNVQPMNSRTNLKYTYRLQACTKQSAASYLSIQWLAKDLDDNRCATTIVNIAGNNWWSWSKKKIIHRRKWDRMVSNSRFEMRNWNKVSIVPAGSHIEWYGPYYICPLTYSSKWIYGFANRACAMRIKIRQCSGLPRCLYKFFVT